MEGCMVARWRNLIPSFPWIAPPRPPPWPNPRKGRDRILPSGNTVSSQLHVAAPLREQEAGVGHLGLHGGVLQRAEERRLQDHPTGGGQTCRVGLVPRRHAADPAVHGGRESLLQGECFRGN